MPLPRLGRSGKPVTNLVTTCPVSARPSTTASDCRNALTCENQTQQDYLRRIRDAWHAEGQEFESSNLNGFSCTCSAKKCLSSHCDGSCRRPCALGPGQFSIDHLFGVDEIGEPWRRAAPAAGLSISGAAVQLAVFRKLPSCPQPGQRRTRRTVLPNTHSLSDSEISFVSRRKFRQSL
jgi:hypothetical protein